MKSLWRRLAPLVGVGLLIAALWYLRYELRIISFDDVATAFENLPLASLILAAALTAANYAVLTGYDLLAFVYLERNFPKWQICTASFVGYAISNNVGWAMISGPSARYRFYSRWGISGRDISRLVMFYQGTFWLGLLMLGGWSLIVYPPAAPGATAHLPASALWALTAIHDLAVPTGVMLLAMCAAYVAASVWIRRPLSFRGFSFTLPRPGLVARQFLLSTVDWALAVAILWVLLPAPRPPFAETTSAFIAAQLVGLVLHVPGALGVFEALMIVFLPSVPPATIIPALLLFRVIYYLVPLSIALVVLLIDESYQRRHLMRRWGSAVGTFSISLAPRLLAVFTFLAGAVLLFSGATPAITTRLADLAQLFPDPVIELSHFIGSLVGVLLLLVSQALARRADAAWTVTVGLLVVGMLTSLLKGFDYEEAIVLALLLTLLIAARGEFDRRSAVFEHTFSRSWFTAVALVVLASAVLGQFAFRHQYSEELWWRFTFWSDASRFLRATVGVSIVLLAVGMRQLLRPGAPRLPLPTDADVEAVAPVIATQRTASGYLAYLRDKAILWNDDRTAFLMYAVKGRTWVALHDPVGAPHAVPELIRKFLELVDDSDGIPVFYQVRKDHMHRYADFGLAFAKAGEEALVPLPTFSLDGGARKKMRLYYHRLTKEGASFRIVAQPDVAAIMPDLRDVSDAWLSAKASAEKGFSLGFFNEEYLRRFPVVVMEVNNKIEAFASLWPGPRKIELSVDLMRFRPTAPKSSMEGLLIYLMLWGKTEGYQWFNLGMAPLSGLETTTLAPLWVKIAAYMYRYGELFYNFQGLRAFKDKFGPVWEPMYLAYPGGLSLPRVLADVSALIAGGYHGILLKRGR